MKENNLAFILDLIKEKRENFDSFSQEELNWNDYDFGKNFYLNVARDEEQTELETEFIIEKLRLKKTDKILDLGCGGGRNAFALEEKGFNLTGVDLNKYAIEQAQKTAQIRNSKINFIHNNILNINYQNEFNVVFLIFNHFSSFNNIEVKKVLKIIEKALIQEGKLLIEINSIAHAEALNEVQEWHIVDSWISGNFKQLVLVENFYNEDKEIHIRRDYCIRLSDLELFTYTQTSQLYTLDKIHSLLKIFDLKIKQIYGDWEGKIFEESDEKMLLIAQK